MNQMLPPAEMNFVGDGDFSAVGDHFLEHFIKVGGLLPQHRVLDVGCGIGRMALPLTNYLSPAGSYEGFDIVDVGIQWCQANITPRFPNFRFQVADVFNRGYNPSGAYLASEYRFPFPKNSFDFAFLTSVFTHMLPAEVENYLAELSRVLKIGGCCMATCFLRNEESEVSMHEQKSFLKFDTLLEEGCWVSNPNLPEDAVCFKEEYLVEQFHRHGFAHQQVFRGAWSGRQNSLTAHDVIVGTKDRAFLKPIGDRMLCALRRALKPPVHKPAGTWIGATESGVTRARAYVNSHPEAMQSGRVGQGRA